MLAQFQQFDFNFEVLKMPSDNFCSIPEPKSDGRKQVTQEIKLTAELKFISCFLRKQKEGPML